MEKRILKNIHNCETSFLFPVLDGHVFHVGPNRILFRYIVPEKNIQKGTIEIYGRNAKQIIRVFQKYRQDAVAEMSFDSSTVIRVTTHLKIENSRTNTCSYSLPKSKIASENQLVGRQVTEIFHLVENFMDAKELYRSCNLKHNLKLLLYGVPGSGKSTVPMALAKKYGFSVDIITSHTPFESITGFSSRASNPKLREQPYQICIFEEIDEILEQEGGTDVVLSFLSGVMEAENLIIILTTNHLDRIDPRVTRSRRIDYMIECKNLDYNEAFQLKNRFPISSEEMESILLDAEADENGCYNPAYVEDLILKYCRKEKIEKKLRRE